MVNIFLDKLSKTKLFLREQIGRLIGLNTFSKTALEEIEAVLIQADLGLEISNLVIKEIEKIKPSDNEGLYSVTRNVLLNILEKNSEETQLNTSPAGPVVILILGVNGTGKTTTIAKLAYKLRKENKKVLLAAADTFRAAAIEQLEILANRAGVDIIKNVYKSDASAVAYDAVKAAISRSMDYLIIDTAGRFHTKHELVDELKKIERTINKNLPGAPHEKLLVLDANTGQNALVQARQFHEALNLTGIIVTKLDGTAKGGIIVNIQKELNIPVKFIGIGQDLNDLEKFDPKTYVEAII